jgi:Bacterial conjugation TrbI-like protein
MSKNEKAESNGKNHLDEDLITDIDAEVEKELPQAQPGLRHRVRKLFENMQQGALKPRQEMAKDRTRSLALLIGGTVGAVLLFIGVFSTPTIPPTQERSGRAVPNLGRGTAPNQPSGPRSSVTPLLNADVGTDNDNSDQLSAADIQGTSGRASPDNVRSPAATPLRTRVSQAPLPPTRNSDGSSSLPNGGPDPLAAYRLNTSTGTSTYSYGGPPAGAAELSRTYANGGAAPIAANSRLDAPTSPKSSIVFMRSPDSTTPAGVTPSTLTSASEQTSLLPPGTRLAARLEAAATTALKMPAVASIEYNYERDGMIVVPAGTKVFGDVQQASSEGYVNIRFHTLRLPDGREEAIEGTGVSLDQKPLKGQVSGKNTGKKVLSRTLSGVGTVAAYVVGGGAGLGRAITGETLLRDRLASNVALAGEQELANAAYSQNISVTVPANTRFYVVLQKPAVATSPSRIDGTAIRSAEIPTAQELRELMELRREINRMYQESNSSLPREAKP